MFNSINYLWRLLGTGFSFAMFFGGGLVLAITVFPAIALVERDADRRGRATHAVIHHAFRLFVAMLEALGIIRVEVRGRQTLQSGGGRLIIANHPTLLDVVILMSLVPHAQCIVKADLWRNRYLGGVVRWAGYIRNDLEPEALLEACRVAMAAGKDLIIFPEGTRSRPGERLQFRRGFANIALLADAQIQLVAIDCRPIMLSKGDPWWKIPAKRSHFRILVGDRLDAADSLGYQYRSLAARHLVKRLQAYFTEQLELG
ncbi:lysophospholipid acyltransferase family protein [Dongia rigui]|uniref:Lysophospholipid acyltransferase family protein n=1 Tax=Dongia rigui TaxID=940149 RepID=A0ABU5E189_9PROT|nr:lysophospholipid acyltransferase family protein [Dongia rigui]MDY0873325.1 lysophospholipid acyltransferase family protein [Dongia rigui]